MAARAGSATAGIVLAVAGALYFGFVVACIINRQGDSIRPGWSAKAVGGGYVVAETDATEPFRALMPGDRIVSVAGDARAGFYGPALALASLPRGRWYTVEFQRGATAMTAYLPMLSGEGAWRDHLPNLTVAFLMYAMAVYIAVARWRDLTARLAFASFILAAFAMAAVIIFEFPGWNRVTAAVALAVAGLYRPWEVALTFHFCSRFPLAAGETPVHSGMRQALYFCAALFWIPVNAPVLANVVGIPPLPVIDAILLFRPDGVAGGPMIASFEAVGGVLACLALARNYVRLPDPVSRRKIRWAGLAIGATVATFVLFSALNATWRLTGSDPIRDWATWVNSAGTVVVGLSFAGLTYAVAKHRVLGIRFVLRRGLQYLLATNVLRLVTFLPVLTVLAKIVANPERGLRHILLESSWQFYVALAVTGGLSLRYHRQMRIWLDRKFFRAALEKEQMLSALIDRVKGVESEEELCLAAGRELEAALHVNGCHFFLLSHDGRMRVAYSQSPEVAARLRGWLNGEGLTVLGGESIVPLYEPPSSGSLEGEPDQDPTEYLAVPITGTRARAVGILVLGPKRSEQPYTEPERGLLKSIAAQMAILHEILNLKERVQKEERVRVQVLGRLDQQGVRLLNECPDCGRCYTSGVSICEHDGTSLSLTLPIERTIEERYLLERRIGHGGMGVVYRAHDVRLDRQVAVKVLLGDLFGNSAAMARLEREARAAAALNHPNIVGVYDIGRLPSGGAYLVMELIDGNSWREHLKGLRRIALDRAFGWLRDLCSAMEGAHASGIIHRDLKPENIMIGESGGVERAIVLDFGLAKICADLSREEKELTISGAVMGTRGYMSPEQRSGRKVDPRTDVFSVAVICAETVTGNRPPRCGASIQWLDGCLRARTPVELRLRRVLRQGLEERPNRRPTMRDFREQLSGAVLIGARAVAAVDAERAATVTLPPRGGDNR